MGETKHQHACHSAKSKPWSPSRGEPTNIDTRTRQY